MNDTPAISVEHLSLRYGGVTALDDVTLNVERGSVLAVVGRNGAGKSSLLQCMLGLTVPQSGNSQLFFRAQKTGDFVEFVIPAKDMEARKILLHATRATDYGVLRFKVNGKPAGNDFDGYASKPIPTGAVNLGVHEPRDGKFILRVEVVGTNPASTGAKYLFGLDAVVPDKP